MGLTWFLLVFIECYHVLPDFTEFYCIFSEFYWVLLGFT